MKKFLLTLALTAGVAFAGHAASELRFYEGNTQIANGSTIGYADYKVTDLGGGLRKVVIEPELYIWANLTTNTVNITANCTTGQTIQMCCGGDCMKGATVTKSGVRVGTKDSGRLNLEFEYESDIIVPGQDIELPAITVEFDAVDTNNSSAHAYFTLNMGKNASVETVEVSDGINVSASAIDYSLNGQATVEVYTLLGTKVMSNTISGHGSLSLSSLKEGVYIYSVRGAATKSGKLLIRK